MADWMAKVNEHHARAQQVYPKAPVFATMLYGSQNYRLDTPESDVDTKVMLIPSLNTLIHGKKLVSAEVFMDDGSIANCKDFRLMLQNFAKSNINFLECLFTQYVVVNDDYWTNWEELMSLRNLIANARPLALLHASVGMAQQKYLSFSKHFAGKEEVLAKYGYDPKQLMHLVRLFYFIRDYNHTRDFQTALVPEQYACDFMMELKVHPVPLPLAEKLKQEYRDKVDEQINWADEHFEHNEKAEAECDARMSEFVEHLMVTYLARQFSPMA